MNKDFFEKQKILSKGRKLEKLTKKGGK